MFVFCTVEIDQPCCLDTPLSVISKDNRMTTLLLLQPKDGTTKIYFLLAVIVVVNGNNGALT